MAFTEFIKQKRVGRDVIPAHIIDENFKDGKVKGKSRPGRVKRAGASCKGSVTSLRKKAKNSSGEKAKMYHWCAKHEVGKKIIMLIKEIINEVASAGATSSGNIATLAFPMTPGTTHAQAIKAVDPFGKIFKNAKKKRKEIYKMGYSPDLLAYRTKVKDIYPMLKR